jgi:hypothetical protein
MLPINTKLPKVINTLKKKEVMMQTTHNTSDTNKPEALTKTLKKKEENDANDADKQ